MIVILVDSFATVIAIDILSKNTDCVPEDLRANYTHILRHIGISDNLEDAENHLEYYHSNWKYNVRIFQFDALYDEEYWEVFIFAIDPKKEASRFTAIFVDETGEFKIFLSNAQNEQSAMSDLREQIGKKGFEWSADNVEEVFSVKWVSHNLLNYCKKKMNISGLREFEWNKNYHENQFARLRCFLSKNE